MTKVHKSLPAVVWKEGQLFVARTIGLELASQGSTQKEALGNLQEALDLLLEEDCMKIIPKELPTN
jgi:hypothetical protein